MNLRVRGQFPGNRGLALGSSGGQHLVVLDLRMPGGDGIEATRRITAASPHIAVLLLTMHDDEGVQLTGSVAVDRAGHVLDKPAGLFLVSPFTGTD